MASTADGRFIAIVGESSGTVTAYDVTTGQAFELAFTADGPVARLEFVPDGSGLIVSTATSVSRVPLDGSGPSVLVESAEGSLGPAAIAPDGTWIAVPVGSADRVQIALWRAGEVSMIDLPVVGGVNAATRRVAERTHVG